MLSELLAIRLKQIPNTEEVHVAVRDWLQKTLIERIGDQTNVDKMVSDNAAF